MRQDFERIGTLRTEKKNFGATATEEFVSVMHSQEVIIKRKIAHNKKATAVKIEVVDYKMFLFKLYSFSEKYSNMLHKKIFHIASYIPFALKFSFVNSLYNLIFLIQISHFFSFSHLKLKGTVAFQRVSG